MEFVQTGNEPTMTDKHRNIHSTLRSNRHRIVTKISNKLVQQHQNLKQIGETISQPEAKGAFQLTFQNVFDRLGDLISCFPHQDLLSTQDTAYQWNSIASSPEYMQKWSKPTQGLTRITAAYGIRWM